MRIQAIQPVATRAMAMATGCPLEWVHQSAVS